MAPSEADYNIVVHLDELLASRGMTLTELADAVDITIVNLSILKNGRARAIRFSTLSALCEVLGCQPGELLSYRASASDLCAKQASSWTNRGAIGS